MTPAALARWFAPLRRRVLLVPLLLPWLVAPGLRQPDTKLDLTVDPVAYLARAMDAWNTHNGVGELQNQAYGYLLPMGPFHLVGDWIGLPPWVIQRLWWCLVLVVAYAGAERLLRTWGLPALLGARSRGGPSARDTGGGGGVEAPGARRLEVGAAVGGLAFALAPRALSVLTEISVETWPVSLAPWLVLAALPLCAPGLTRRGLLVAMVRTAALAALLGGVNATASLFALVPAFVVVVTARVRGAEGGSMGRSVLRWAGGVLAWGSAALLGAFWWLAPLLVLGGYGYPFLEHIEQSTLTTAVTSLPNVLRGTSHWIPFILDSEQHPTWQGGFLLAQSIPAVVGTALIAAAGLAGLALAATRVAARVPDDVSDTGAGGIAPLVDAHERSHVLRWARACLLAGVLFMVAPHAADHLGAPLAEPLRAFLDGPGAPLRNVHKAEPLVRLPLVLGLGVIATRALDVLAAQRGSARVDARGGERSEDAPSAARSVGSAAPAGRRPAAVAALVVLALAGVGLLTPLWQGRLGDAGAYRAIPAEVDTMARAVDEAAARHGGSTLLLPMARFADFGWGRTNDEPLAAAAGSQVLVRNAAPLGPPGATRVLDEVDRLTATGQGQPQLTETLRRLGVRRIVTRTDLVPAVGASPADLVEKSLAASPGITRVSATGPMTLWSVEGATGAGAVVARGLPLVAGAPEDLPRLRALGLVGPDQPVQLAGDTGSRNDPSGPVVLTDGLRRRVLNSSAPNASAHGPTTTADDPAPDAPGRTDFSVGGTPTTRYLEGARGIEATSSAASPFAASPLGPQTGPYAAIDGDLATAWFPDADPSTLGGTWTLTLDRPTPLGRIDIRTLTPELSFEPVDQLTVTAWDATRGGARTTKVEQPDASGRATVDLTGVTADHVSVKIISSNRSQDVRIGLAEVKIAGAPVTTGLTLGAPAQTVPRAVVIGRATPVGTPLVPASEDPATLVRRTPLPTGTLAVRARVEGMPRATTGRSATPTSPQEPVPAPSAADTCGAAGQLRVGTGPAAVTVPLRPEGPVAPDGTRAAVGCARVPRDGADPTRVETLTVSSGPTMRVRDLALVGSETPTAAPVPVSAQGNAATGTLRIGLPEGAATSAPAAATSGSSAPTSAAPVLVLPDSANAGWVARDVTNGRTLTRVTVDGWKQGFRLADTTRRVEVGYEPQGFHRSTLLGGLALAALLVLAALASLHPRLRPGPRATEALALREPLHTNAARAPRGGGAAYPLLAAASTALVAWLVGGWWALPLAALAIVLPRRALAPVAGAGMAACGLAIALFGMVEQRTLGALLGHAAAILALGATLMAIARRDATNTNLNDQKGVADAPGAIASAGHARGTEESP